MNNFTTTDIIQELRNPDNFVEVEWNHPETVSPEDKEFIKNEAEEVRTKVTDQDVAELLDLIILGGADTPLLAASMFIDLYVYHGEYNTLTVTLTSLK